MIGPWGLKPPDLYNQERPQIRKNNKAFKSDTLKALVFLTVTLIRYGARKVYKSTRKAAATCLGFVKTGANFIENVITQKSGFWQVQVAVGIAKNPQLLFYGVLAEA